ncbi:MAG: 3'-5' exonuclease [Betaproteobacteria bacterium]|nr:3'-5' exonuclease [Betaproteobacteria bacterium]
MLHAGLLYDKRGTDTSPDWPRRFAELARAARDERLRSFYSAGIVSGDTPIRDVPLLALDVETTGLNPAVDAIVSVGLVPMTLDRVRASAARHWLVKPRVPLSEDSITIHGITHSQLDRAPDLVEVLGDILDLMARHVMVVHCREIERLFLGAALVHRINEGIEFPVIDTMQLEGRLYRNRPASLWRRLWPRRETPVSIRLSPSRQRYGLPRYRLHHAVTDALATGELLQAQIAHRFSPTTPVGELWA